MPPAWQWLLLLCYERYPPANLSEAKRAAEASAVRAMPSRYDHTDAAARGLTGKALRRALVQYHPDKNRAAVCGARWAVFCEEIAKIVTGLLAEAVD